MKKVLGLGVVLALGNAWAYYAPVEVASPAERAAVSEPVGAATSRLTLLNQISELQGQVQTLNGRLEEQQHQIAQLTDQLQRFYKDLDLRMQHAQGLSSQAASASGGIEEGDGQDAKAYNQAFQQLQQRHYQQASQSLTAFAEQYPNSGYVANAYYWLGQLYLMQGQTSQAETMLTRVVNQFPQHQKAPDALLKLAKIATERQDTTQAKTLLQQLQDRFPNSPAAQVAQVQLRQLG